MSNKSHEMLKPIRVASFTEQEDSDDDDILDPVSGFGGFGKNSKQNYGNGACGFSPAQAIRESGKQHVPRALQAPSLFADTSAALTSQFNSIPMHSDVLQMDSNSRLLLGASGISSASTDASSSHSRSRSGVANYHRTSASGGLMNSVLNASLFSSTAVNLTNDDDEDDNVNFLQFKMPPRSPLRMLDNNATNKRKQSKEVDDTKDEDVPFHTYHTVPNIQSSWDSNHQQEWNQTEAEIQPETDEAKRANDQLATQSKSVEPDLLERLRCCTISLSKKLIAFEDPTPVVSEEVEFVPLTEEHQNIIQSALTAPRNQTLISKFRQNITNYDIMTLAGFNWLNDEIINFYMNLLMDRSEHKHLSHGLPRVHAMNTFFVPRLLESGYTGVKRWTRKVDIFSFDIIPVPVYHRMGHWGMAIIHLKNKTLKYYDSMGLPNAKVLDALKIYLQSESVDKLEIPFEMADFLIESVQDAPMQQNGNDCGVFSCMFAEYITRNKDITFTQRNMNYFREKMIVEIVQGKLLQ